MVVKPHHLTIRESQLKTGTVFSTASGRFAVGRDQVVHPSMAIVEQNNVMRTTERLVRMSPLGCEAVDRWVVVDPSPKVSQSLS